MASQVKERYLTDENGNRVAVVLEITEYNRLLAELEELEDVRAFDAAKAKGDKPIPVEAAVAEIERKRSKK